MSGPEDLTGMSVADLSLALTDRRCSSLELVEACLDRIAHLDPKLHAFVTVYVEEARDAAKAADSARRAGIALGPLHGIPYGLKDLVQIEGRIATGGSRVWVDRIAKETAVIARRLAAAGMIVIGKTHTVEFAFGAWGTNQHMGTPRNPWDLATHRTPGGSSSGSGVAVASRMVPWAIGTDTGGSVRIPAAMCGITGLKTTAGQISTAGVLPLSPTLDTIGPIARSVADAAMIYQVLRDDSARLPADTLTRGVKGLRLARMPDAERTGVDADVIAAYDDSLRVLADLGADIVDCPLPYRFADFADLTGRLIAAEGYAFVGPIVDDETLPVDEAVRARFKPARTMLAGEYFALMRKRGEMQAAMEQALAPVDALLTPTTLVPAIAAEGADASATVPAHFTRMVNIIGGCAVALPNGQTPSGLPTSLQIVCTAGNEALALRIGQAFQQATGWHRRAPAL